MKAKEWDEIVKRATSKDFSEFMSNKTEKTLNELIEEKGQEHVKKCINAHEELMEFVSDCQLVTDEDKEKAIELVEKYGESK